MTTTTHAQIVELLVDVDDLFVKRIEDTGASLDEIGEALGDLENEDMLGEPPRIPSSPRVAEVRAILEELMETDGTHVAFDPAAEHRDGIGASTERDVVVGAPEVAGEEAANALLLQERHPTQAPGLPVVVAAPAIDGCCAVIFDRPLPARRAGVERGCQGLLSPRTFSSASAVRSSCCSSR